MRFCITFKTGQMSCAEVAPYIQEDAAAEEVVNEAPAWLCWMFFKGVGRDTSGIPGMELQGDSLKIWHRLTACCLLSLCSCSLCVLLWAMDKGIVFFMCASAPFCISVSLICLNSSIWRTIASAHVWTSKSGSSVLSPRRASVSALSCSPASLSSSCSATSMHYICTGISTLDKSAIVNSK